MLTFVKSERSLSMKMFGVEQAQVLLVLLLHSPRKPEGVQPAHIEVEGRNASKSLKDLKSIELWKINSVCFPTVLSAFVSKTLQMQLNFLFLQLSGMVSTSYSYVTDTNGSVYLSNSPIRDLISCELLCLCNGRLHSTKYSELYISFTGVKSFKEPGVY